MSLERGGGGAVGVAPAPLPMHSHVHGHANLGLHHPAAIHGGHGSLPRHQRSYSYDLATDRDPPGLPPLGAPGE